MQLCQTTPYKMRMYYRALSGETAPRRVIQLPPVFEAAIGDGIVQVSQIDGTGIVQIHRVDGRSHAHDAMTAMDRVRSKRNGQSLARYILIAPEIYMRPEDHYTYEDAGVLWLVPISVNEVWRVHIGMEAKK